MKNNTGEYWGKKREKLIQKFPTISEKDLYYQVGKEREMIERVGYKLGKTNQELLHIIVEL
jgi:hypothetical protein